jgi:mannitol/fructose-specific phosphotransferase system IIA component
MEFKNYLLEQINKNYHICVTVGELVYKIVSIAYSKEESIQLINKATPMLVQYEYIGKMENSTQLMNFIDKYVEDDYTFLYGVGVPKNLHL